MNEKQENAPQVNEALSLARAPHLKEINHAAYSVRDPNTPLKNYNYATPTLAPTLETQRAVYHESLETDEGAGYMTRRAVEGVRQYGSHTTLKRESEISSTPGYTSSEKTVTAEVGVKGQSVDVLYVGAETTFGSKPSLPDTQHEATIVRKDEKGNVVYRHNTTNPDMADKIIKMAAKRIIESSEEVEEAKAS